MVFFQAAVSDHFWRCWVLYKGRLSTYQWFFQPVLGMGRRGRRSVQKVTGFYSIYHMHFGITGVPCYLIGSHRCNLFENSKSHLFLANEESSLKCNNQSDFKACLKKQITLQENENNFCNFLRTSSPLDR